VHPHEPITDASERFERLVREPEDEQYVLRLYVTGMTQRSMEAVDAIRKLCEERLQGRYDLEVIDLYEKPAMARSQQIIAAPTLVKQAPLPTRQLIGNLASKDRVLDGLGLPKP